MVNSNLAYKETETLQPENTIQEKPVKWCEVSLSDVMRKGNRLDASSFDVEAMKAYTMIENNKYGYVPLYAPGGMVENAYYGSRLKRNYVDSKSSGAVGFLGSSEMLDTKPMPVKYMLDGDKVADLHIQEGTVLLSRSGTIGNVTYVGKTLSQFLVSEHAIRLECREFPGYVYAFLKSDTGRSVIRSNTFGAVIDEIEPEHLSTVPIPNAPYLLRKQIHDLVVISYALRDNSNDLIDEATRLLVDELHLPDISDFEVEDYKKGAPVETYSVKLSELSGRVDASYHVPIVDAIIEHMKKYAAEVTTIADERISKDVILPGRFKRVYVEEGYGRVFIGGKQLWELDPINKKYLSLVHHGERIAKQLELHENMTLITCSGTIGKVTLVGKHWENWTANQHIIRVVPSSDDIAGYISVFLSSEYGYPLITRYTYGSVVDEIDDNHVRSIAIPLLKNKDVQKKINDLALLASEKRYEAYQLEQQALSIMNDKVLQV